MTQLDLIIVARELGTGFWLAFVVFELDFGRLLRNWDWLVTCKTDVLPPLRKIKADTAHIWLMTVLKVNQWILVYFIIWHPHVIFLLFFFFTFSCQSRFYLMISPWHVSRLPSVCCSVFKTSSTWHWKCPSGGHCGSVHPRHTDPLCSTFCSGHIQAHWPRFTSRPDSLLIRGSLGSSDWESKVWGVGVGFGFGLVEPTARLKRPSVLPFPHCAIKSSH